MKNILNKIRCLFGFHDNATIPGDRIMYDGGYRVVGVTYHVCKRCGKAYSATTVEAEEGPGVA